MERLSLLEVRSHLAILDVQTKLTATMLDAEMQIVIRKCSQLMQAAKQSGVPMLVTEHYPVDMGSTIPEIARNFEMKPIAKIATSACKEPEFTAQLHEDKFQIVLIGLEANTSILHTAKDLIKRDKQVFVVEDAIISRRKEDKKRALIDLAYHGCTIINTESVLSDWSNSAV